MNGRLEQKDGCKGEMVRYQQKSGAKHGKNGNEKNRSTTAGMRFRKRKKRKVKGSSRTSLLFQY